MCKPNFFLCATLLAASLFLPVSLLAQSAITDPGAKRICDAVKDVQMPPQDQPIADEKAGLKNCSSQDLYFGFGGPADPVKARKCAYVEMENGKDDLDIAGRAILMMVYANGNGADRNLDLAIKFACQMQGGPGDVLGNIYELDRLRKAPPSARFSVCDHSSSPHLYKSCAILGDRSDRVDRAQRVASITSQWSARDRKAFQPVQQAGEKFFKSRANNEINLQITFEVQEVAFMEREFIARLEQLQKGQLPRFSVADARNAQAELDEVYAATQKDPSRRWGTATVEGVRKTQQLWIPYRDAWVKFGKTKYPNVSDESWRTWITQERIAMLKHLVE